MKKIALFVFILIASSAFAQNFKINNSSGDVLYVDGGSNIGIAVEGYESSKVIATASILGILEGENGRYFVNLENSKMGRAKVGDKVEISVYVEKEDGNYLVGSKTFEVKRKSDFEMKIGNFKTGDKVTAADIDAFENITVLSGNAAVSASIEFKVVSFSAIIVPKDGPAESIYGVGSTISPTMKIHFKKWQDGSRILIDDIVLENAKGERKLGSRMMLIYSEERGVYIQQFYNKEFYNKEEFLNLEKIDAIDKSNGDVLIIAGYHFLIVHKEKESIAEAFSSSSNELTKNIKDSIERTLKPGDKILFDDIIYQKPDGTEGRCAPVRILIL